MAKPVQDAESGFPSLDERTGCSLTCIGHAGSTETQKGNMTHKSIIERDITTNQNVIPLRSQPRAKPWGSGILSPFRRVLVGAFLLGVATGGTRADVVIDWNVAMTDYVTPRSPATLGPPAKTRVYAMAHLAMLEATKEDLRQHHGVASPEAAGAQAAHDVLAHEFADGVPELRYGKHVPTMRRQCPFQRARPG